MKFPTIEEMAKDVAEKALDEYVHEGKTLRQWVEVLKEYVDKKTTLEMIVERLEGLKGKDYFSSEDFDGTKHFYFYEETEEHDEMIDYAIEIIKEGLM